MDFEVAVDRTPGSLEFSIDPRSLHKNRQTTASDSLPSSIELLQFPSPVISGLSHLPSLGTLPQSNQFIVLNGPPAEEPNDVQSFHGPIRTHRIVNPTLGNNKYGRKGHPRCSWCRKHRKKVLRFADTKQIIKVRVLFIGVSMYELHSKKHSMQYERQDVSGWKAGPGGRRFSDISQA